MIANDPYAELERRFARISAVSSSAAASAVVSAPTKKSAALMVRSLTAERARSRPPSARTIAGSSDAGSALARLPLKT